MRDLEQHSHLMRLKPPIFLGIGKADDESVHDRWTSASVVHDLRNPLATISAGLEMLTDLDAVSPGLRRVVVNMGRAASRMRQLLTDLEAASRGKVCPRETCEIGEIIMAAWDAVTGAVGTAALQFKSVQFKLDNPETIHLLLVRSRIERAFFNLIANACEAMPGGGRILITVRRAGDCAFVSVEDTGPGIPESIRHRLFEPYATAGKEGGLGLGLALARHAVREHGGDLWIDSTAAARFLIRLPLAPSLGA